MRKLIFSFLVAILAVSCSENERLIYDNGTKIYFDNYSAVPYQVQDSLVLSLLAQTEEFQAYDILIGVLGQPSETDKTFKVVIVADSTDAVEGVHYKALEQSYTLPAGVMEFNFPLYLSKDDRTLFDMTKTVTLRIIDTDEVQTCFIDKSYLRVMFDLKLTKPTGEATGWSDMSFFVKLFGEYSQVKHAKIIELAGHDFWDVYGKLELGLAVYPPRLSNEEDYWRPYAALLYTFYTENQVEDENGKIIELW